MIIDFNDNWMFSFEGDEKTTPIKLPHDAMLHSLRSPDSKGASGVAYFNGGVYIYKKTFKAPEDWRDKHLTFHFQGVYRNAEVSINGQKAGENKYGFSFFDIKGDDLIKAGQDNEIVVRADNKYLPNSRWYSGGGIYRPVEVYVQDKSHLLYNKARVRTLSIDPAEIEISIPHEGGEVTYAILDQEGKKVFEGKGDKGKIKIQDAKLWSDLTPYLYTLRVSLKNASKTVDEEEIRFGIRQLTYSTQGFFVNGKKTLLRGGCIHSDNGILGACSYKEAEFRKARILKETGFNLIRSAHNPMSDSFLQACDELGIMVMDELTDMWYQHKNKYDYATDFLANYKEDITKMVDKDYNHPSVVMYSIGNEITEPATSKGVEMAKELVKCFHEADDSRPTTAGINLMLIKMADGKKSVYKNADKEEKGVADQGTAKINSTFFNMIVSIIGGRMDKMANSKKVDKITSPVLDCLDIAGYNYASGRYPLEAKAHPNRMIIGSETFPHFLYQNWEKVKALPYVFGDCMWTAFDYLGEVGIGTWAYDKEDRSFTKPYPGLLAEAGIIDIIGNTEGAEVGLTKTVWGLSDKPLIYIRPLNQLKKPTKAMWRGTDGIASWSWQGCQGRKGIVEVYSSAPYVELYVNDKKIKRVKTKKDCALFKHVKYVPGTIKAVALDSAMKPLNENSLISSNGSLNINIHPEQEKSEKGKLAFFDINLEGENGIVESNADTTLEVKVEGGEMLAFGSSKAKSEHIYYEGIFPSHYGHALLVVRPTEDKIKITIKGETLAEKTFEF
ncbi:MAG: DUF4982 domain-containing protein [Bacilli bacterium]|jgi:hypothetical protein|nr:DUF4982 domain-containing protein [Bacilli bacterium]